MNLRQKGFSTCYLSWVLAVVLSGLTGCGSVLGSGTYNKAWSPQEQCRAVHFWVANFTNELPKVPASSMNEKYYVNLFRDEYFVPVFGTPFDRMSEQERKNLYAKTSKCSWMIGGYKDWQDLQRYQQLIDRSWNDVGAEYAASARGTKQWQDRVLAELKSAPPSEETFDKFLQAKAHAKTAMERFLPAEQHVFNEALDHEGRRVAEAALVARINRASAVASTYEGLKQLQAVVDDQQGLFDLVPPPVKAREEARAAQAYQVGFTKVLEGDWKRFEARGTGITAVTNGVLWHRDLEDRYYGIFDIGPPVHAVLNRFREAREKDLAESATSIIQTLKASATTAEGLNEKQEEYLVHDDTLVRAAKPIYAWIEHQKAALNFQKEKWRFSENEINLMKTPGYVTVPSSYGPPSGDDIRMALLRAYVSAGGRLVDRNTATVATASFDDLLGTIGNGGLPRMSVGTVSIGSVSVEGCSEGKGSALVGNYGRSKGYLCRYTAKGQVTSDEFMLTSEGWLSPTADDRVGENRNRMTHKFIEDVGSAVPKVGCRDRRGVLNWWCR